MIRWPRWPTVKANPRLGCWHPTPPGITFAPRTAPLFSHRRSVKSPLAFAPVSLLRLLTVRLSLGVALFLTGCHASRIEETAPDPFSAPTVQGEWQLLNVRTMPGHQDDPKANTAMRLTLVGLERPLGRGRIQLPRWIFRPDNKVLIRWPAVGDLPRRTRGGGTYRRNLVTRELFVRTRSGAPEQRVTFIGDTLLLTDATNHLVTRMLPVY